MAEYLVTDGELTATADSIRAKSGLAAPIEWLRDSGFAAAIEAIPSGSTAGGTAGDAVRCFDYDGTIVASYSAAEFAALNALPDNPTHARLTPQGWNWSLANAKAHVAKYGRLNIGQMYATKSGATEIDIVLREGRTSPYLGFALNGTATIDWGDGSAIDTVSGISVTTTKYTQHNYAAPGEYTIKITGPVVFFGSRRIMRYGTSNDNRDYGYLNSVRAVHLGSSVTAIGNDAFRQCYALSAVTIPNSVTSIGTYSFYSCYSLTAMMIPDAVTGIGDSACYNCFSMLAVSLPKSITGTGLGPDVFGLNYSLPDVTLPDDITALGNSTFNACYSLAEICVPEGVASIGSTVFSSCHSLKSLRFFPASPPTVANSNAFSMPTDCVIYVPAGKLAAYTGATNYPSSSTFTYVEF